jgi:hypothetical protein
MALNYNLAKVYALSDNDPEFVNEILTLFVTEVPEDLAQIKEGIKRKIISMPMLMRIKLKPTLDLLGLNVALKKFFRWKHGRK